MKNQLTVCIPTHAVKAETRGPYANMHNIVPSAPSSKMIEHIIEDLFKKTDLPKDIRILIGVDNRVGRPIDDMYVMNLRKLESKYNLKVIPNNALTLDPLVSAPENFVKLIGSVETPYYLFWEHDWIFNHNIALKPLVDNMQNRDIFYVRFNQHINQLASCAAETIMEPEINTDVPLLRVDHMGNNPYICKTETFNKWWKFLLYETPEQGGFVEGPINVFFKFSVLKMGFKQAMNQWKIYVYGNLMDPPAVSHLNGNTYR